jgi:hypothetical protein
VLPKLEEMILLALLRLGPDATAGGVQAVLSEATGREQAFGSVFTTLGRLTAKKFVRWKKGLPDATRGGRAPRLYSITGAGQATLRASLSATNTMIKGIGWKWNGVLPVGTGA